MELGQGVCSFCVVTPQIPQIIWCLNSQVQRVNSLPVKRKSLPLYRAFKRPHFVRMFRKCRNLFYPEGSRAESNVVKINLLSFFSMETVWMSERCSLCVGQESSIVRSIQTVKRFHSHSHYVTSLTPHYVSNYGG